MATHEIIIEQKLRQLDEGHRDDGDGGYTLLNAVLTYESQLSPNESLVLRQKLLELIANCHETMWGVALEAVVQLWGRQVSDDLASLLGEQQVDDEWSAQLLLALLRLQHASIREQAIEFVKRRTSYRDREVLPWLAALSHVDQCECTRLATGFFVAAYQNGELEKTQGYVPAFVRNFVEVDQTMILQLVRQIRETDPLAANETALLFLDYIRKPFFVKEFGKDLSADIDEGINRVLAV